MPDRAAAPPRTALAALQSVAEHARIGHRHFAGLLAGCSVHSLPDFPDTGAAADAGELRAILAPALGAQLAAAEQAARTERHQWEECACAHRFYLGRDVLRVGAQRYADLINLMLMRPVRTDARLREALYELTVWTERGGTVPGPKPDFETGMHIAAPL